MNAPEKKYTEIKFDRFKDRTETIHRKNPWQAHGEYVPRGRLYVNFSFSLVRVELASDDQLTLFLRIVDAYDKDSGKALLSGAVLTFNLDEVNVPFQLARIDHQSLIKGAQGKRFSEHTNLFSVNLTPEQLHQIASCDKLALLCEVDEFRVELTESDSGLLRKMFQQFYRDVYDANSFPDAGELSDLDRPTKPTTAFEEWLGSLFISLPVIFIVLWLSGTSPFKHYVLSIGLSVLGAFLLVHSDRLSGYLHRAKDLINVNKSSGG